MTLLRGNVRHGFHSSGSLLSFIIHHSPEYYVHGQGGDKAIMRLDTQRPDLTPYIQHCVFSPIKFPSMTSSSNDYEVVCNEGLNNLPLVVLCVWAAAGYLFGHFDENVQRMFFLEVCCFLVPISLRGEGFVVLLVEWKDVIPFISSTWGALWRAPIFMSLVKPHGAESTGDLGSFTLGEKSKRLYQYLKDHIKLEESAGKCQI